jgi:hypothetical protein
MFGDPGGTFMFESSGGTTLSGPMAFAENGGVASPYNQLGQISPTPSGEGLVLYLAGGANAAGHLTYLLIKN